MHITVIATGFEKVPFPPRASSAERPASLPSQAAYVPQSYSPAYQTPAAGRGYGRYDAAYTPVAGYAPNPAEPEVPAFLNTENAGGQRVSPFAAMPDMPAQPVEQERPAAEEQRAPRSFMDGIPAYMRRK